LGRAIIFPRPALASARQPSFGFGFLTNFFFGRAFGFGQISQPLGFGFLTELFSRPRAWLRPDQSVAWARLPGGLFLRPRAWLQPGQQLFSFGFLTELFFGPALGFGQSATV